VEIKPTTKISTFSYSYVYDFTSDLKLKIINNNPEYETDIQICMNYFYNSQNKSFNDKHNTFGQNNVNFINYHSKPEYTKIMTLDPRLSEFNKFTNWNTNADVYWELLQYVRKTFFTSTGELIDMKFETPLEFYLKNNYVNNVKIKDSDKLIIFIDETKKPNNRKITFYKSIDAFEKKREQFKLYHILDMNSDGILIEEIS
jgi:hypothetical protein